VESCLKRRSVEKCWFDPCQARHADIRADDQADSNPKTGLAGVRAQHDWLERMENVQQCVEDVLERMSLAT